MKYCISTVKETLIMALCNKTKLSLLAEYDDISRHNFALAAGLEKEFKLFVENQKNIRNQIKELQCQNGKLQKRIDSLEREKLRYEIQMKHARNIIIGESEKNKKLELEKNSLERQIALIKELLNDRNGIDNQTKEKLVQLSSIYSLQSNNIPLSTIEESGSLISSSECDETNEDLDPTKCNGSSDDTYKRKSKACEDFFSFDDEYTMKEETVPKTSLLRYRSNSEPDSSSIEEPVARKAIKSDSDQVKIHANDMKSSINQGRSSLPSGRRSMGGKLNRPHAFVEKVFIRSEKCHPCGKMIKFCKQGLKCSDCRVNCHSECKDLCPLPCIPVVSPLGKKNLEKVADYCSLSGPMIPSLIVHCINEIESRGLQDLGLYRVPGSEREVKVLKEKFLKGKSVPSLKEIDIHTLCGTIKEFLRSLKETLLTKDALYTFTCAADNQDETIKLDLIYNAVCGLPQSNKETLAFLIMHLQRVADSPLCKMPVENLSRIFGPTIVGYSADEPSDAIMLMDTKKQVKVMESLLKIPFELWQNLFSAESSCVNAKLKTPDCLSAPVTGRLGPIYTPRQMPRNIDSTLNTTIAPRSARTGRNGKLKYFPSPI